MSGSLLFWGGGGFPGEQGYFEFLRSELYPVKNPRHYCVCVCRLTELQVSLEKARIELEQLREQRARQMQQVESIVRQRDMCRVLLVQATGVSFPQQGERSFTQTTTTSSLFRIQTIFA